MSNEEYEEFDFLSELKKKFPLMYANTFDAWVDKGWQPIIFELSNKIQSYIDRSLKKNDLDKVVPQIQVAQIKEKFGGLRFYYDGGDSTVDAMVSMAESWADHTCEICGASGKSRNLPWVKTLCESHYKEKLQYYKDRMLIKD